VSGTVFWVAGIALAVSALMVALRVPDMQRREADASPADSAGGNPAETAADTAGQAAGARPARLFNRLLIAAVAFNVGGFFAGGSYEVVWSLYLTSLGASMAAIGLTFFSFAFPILVLSPFFGRYIDHHGGFLALVLGLFVVGLCGAAYVLVPEVWFVVAVGLVEGTAFAICSPALYLLVARSAPSGRSSTAQGIFGAAGTVGTIVASLSAGVLADADLRYPFLATSLMIIVALSIGLVIGGRRLYDVMQPAQARPAFTSAAADGATG
jgi:MFS family permease